MNNFKIRMKSITIVKMEFVSFNDAVKYFGKVLWVLNEITLSLVYCIVWLLHDSL